MELLQEYRGDSSSDEDANEAPSTRDRTDLSSVIGTKKIYLSNL